MIVSLNEIESGCYRAALAVGLPHGLAEDAARIGVRLVTSQPDGLAMMLRALRFAEAHPAAPPAFVNDGASWRPRHPALPSLVSGPIAADLRKADPDKPIHIGQPDEPAIIAMCLDGRAFSPPMAPVEVSADLWRELQRLAARTYVPATEISRLKGAGAGLRDDD